MEIKVKCFDSSQGDDDVSKIILRYWDMKRMEKVCVCHKKC